MAAVLAKGQLSYLILSCLEEKDMYGLELIEEIKKRSGVEIKLPSLYSNLNRMKELKFISSYLKESSKGPKCSYSSITENGRKELEKLKDSFANIPLQEEVVSTEKTTDNEIDTNNYDDYNDFFADIPEDKKTATVEEKVSSNKKDIPTQIKMETPKEIKNDAVFLSREEYPTPSNNYNKNFDITKDYNKFKKKKSFSENQIEMVVSCSNQEEQLKEQEKKAENISGLKEALLQKREGKYDEVKLDQFNRNQNINKVHSDPIASFEIEKEVEKKEITNDGKFITDKVDYSTTKTNRFEPSKLSFLMPQQEIILPAPKRNSSIDPNCSDVKARLESLYLKSQREIDETEENEKKQKLSESFDNFDDLKNYYEEQNISFKIFKRTGKRTLHNTNKVLFYVDLITFGLISICSGLLFFLFYKLNLLNANTNFVYYTLPSLFFIYLMIRLYNYKKVPSKVPRPLFNFVVIWGSTILLSVIVFCVNLIFGMSIDKIIESATTVFVPIAMIIISVIIRHYILKFSLKRFWR